MNRAIKIATIVVASILAAAQTEPPAPPAPAAPPAPQESPAPKVAPAPRPPKPPRTSRTYTYSSRTRATAYLGVDIRDLTPERVAALKLKDSHGVEITMVDQDAPAGKAGLKEGDVILSVNGTQVDNEEQLRTIIRDAGPGKTLALSVSRNGQPMTVNVTLGKRSGYVSMNERHIIIPRMDIRIPEIDIPSFTMLQYSRRNGLMVENLTPQLGEFFGVKNGEGVLVRSVEKGSRGEAAGFHAGDVIVKVGKDAVCDTSEFNRIMRQQKAGTVPVTVMRDKREQSLSLTVPERSDQSEMHIEFPDISAEWAQLGPELARTQELMAERMQQEIQQHQKEWQANTQQAQRQAQKEMERARRELEKAMRQMQRQMEKDRE